MEILYTPFFIAEIVFLIGLIGVVGKYYFHLRATIIIKNIFVIQCWLMIVLTILSFFNIYLRGYWTGKVSTWIFWFNACLLFAFGSRLVVSGFLRKFTGFFFYFPMVNFIIYLLVPFLVPLLAFTIWFHVIGDTKSILYNDNEIRIQNNSSLKSMEGWPQLYLKKGLFEINKGKMSVNYFFDPDSLKVKKAPHTITVYLYKKGFDPVPFVFDR